MKMHNLGQAAPFLEMYPTNELALVRNKASLYLLIGNDFEDILSEKCQVQFTKKQFFCLLTKERAANICIDYV